MRVFKMNGMQISSPKRFLTYFSPEDLLREKELAAGFVCHHLRTLSQWNIYHCEMLFMAIFRWSGCFRKPYVKYIKRSLYDRAGCHDRPCGRKPLSQPFRTPPFFGPEDYCKALGPNRNLPYGSSLMEEMEEDGETLALLREIWALSKETGLDTEKQARLFCILSAAYLLAGKTPAECPISAPRAEAAFLGETIQEKESGWYAFGPGGEDALPAREEAYRILLQRGLPLESGKTLRLKKLTAAAHSQGGTYLPVKLALYDGENDTAPREISFLPGDYRYLILAGDTPVDILETRAENGPFRMEREGNRLLLFKNGQQTDTIDCTGREIVSFAPDLHGGYILVEPGWVDYTKYTYQQIFLPTQNILQAELRGGRYLLLKEDGTVATNIGGGYSGITSLHDIKN